MKTLEFKDKIYHLATIYIIDWFERIVFEANAGKFADLSLIYWTTKILDWDQIQA